MVFLRPPRYGRAASPVILLVLMGPPETDAAGKANGRFANAQGLYQLVLFLALRTCDPRIFGSGVPPGANGFRTRIAYAVPPFGPAPPKSVFTESVFTENGNPVWQRIPSLLPTLLRASGQSHSGSNAFSRFQMDAGNIR